MPRYAIVLDACVLYPAPLQDLLSSLATTDLLRARRTTRTHDEWMHVLLRERTDLTAKPKRI